MSRAQMLYLFFHLGHQIFHLSHQRFQLSLTAVFLCCQAQSTVQGEEVKVVLLQLWVEKQRHKICVLCEQWWWSVNVVLPSLLGNPHTEVTRKRKATSCAQWFCLKPKKMNVMSVLGNIEGMCFFPSNKNIEHKNLHSPLPPPPLSKLHGIFVEFRFHD